MAKLTCDFIPGARANWLCPRCDVRYGNTCIPDGTNPLWGKDGPHCILCHSELINVDDPAIAGPFWHKLPYFFAYPLHINALLIIALGAGGVWLLGNDIPALIYLFIWSIMTVKYFFAVIAERASGKRSPPSLLEIVKSDEHYLFVQAILLHVALAALIWATALLTVKHSIPYPFWVILGFSTLLAFAYPAMIMLLAVTKSLWQTLHLGRLADVIGAIGVYYFLLWGFLLLIGLVSYCASLWLFPLVPEAYLLPATVALNSYFSFVTYALMGYTLFQFSDDIGLTRDDNTEEFMEDSAFRRAQALGAVAVLRKKGELDRARQTMRELLDICRDEPELHRQYHDLLLELADDKAIARHTDYLAGLLIENKRGKEAARLVLDTHKRLPDYQPQQLSLVLELAPILKSGKHHRVLAALISNTHKTHKADPALCAAYLLLAETLAGPLQQPQKARQLVLFMLKQYTQMPERRQYEKLLKKLG